MGNKYEGHAVSRLILEQISWAYKVFKLEDAKEIKNTSPTKSISTLKKFIPKAGKLYGYLSKKTHIDYKSHYEFLKRENDKNVIIYGQNNFDEYASILLDLADIFSIVWECSQYDYMTEVESIKKVKDNYLILEDRAFLSIIEDHIKEIGNLSNQIYS